MNTCSTDMKIAVIGGGFAGVAQAIALSKVGFTTVSLIERKSTFSAEGTPIVLSGVGRYIAESILKTGQLHSGTETLIVKGLEIRSAHTNEKLRNFSIDWPGEQYDSIMMERQYFLDKLVRVLDDLPVTMRLGESITDIACDASGVHVTTDHISEPERFDAVIDSGGFNSFLRNSLLTDTDFREDRLLWVVMGALPYDPGQITGAIGKDFACVYFDAGEEAGSIYFTKVPKDKQYTAMKADQDEKRRILLESLAQTKVHPTIVNAAKCATDIVCAPEYTISLKHAYYEQVVFIGDSEHGISPFTGMGTTLALEDAVVLADCLHAAAQESKDIRDAYQAYQERRKKRVHKTQRASRRLNRTLFHSAWLWFLFGDLMIKKTSASHARSFAYDLYHNDEQLQYLESFKKRYEL